MIRAIGSVLLARTCTQASSRSIRTPSLASIEPGLVVPGDGRTVRDLLAALG